MEAARLAPSATNSQPWTFVIADEPALARAVAEATYGGVIRFNAFAAAAPVLVAVVAERSNFTAQLGNIAKRVKFNLIDIGIAAEHFCLQAAAEGLGTCMLGWFDKAKVAKLLAIPRSRAVPLVIAVGYPVDDEIRPKKRKAIDEILRWQRYG